MSAVVVVSLLVAGTLVALPSFSDAADPGALRDQLGQNQAKAQSLSAQVARLAKIERALTKQVAALQRRQAEVQADLDRDEAELAQVREDLDQERARALRLRKRLTQARAALATRMLERYKAPDVDAISVVLNSVSFADLMERTAFIKRIQENDEEILVTVRTARRDALTERRRLDAAEARQRTIVAGLRARRNAV
ncbi:MAG TPA: hypothetical protein VN238_22700, partial [Solirubrobacteraceae bacterium]|nr:hypothetical protein [Solirubrobacteraceae bacterium]